MDDVRIAKLTQDEDGQTLHIPSEFSLPGSEVRISRRGDALVVEPARVKPTKADIDAWFARIDALGGPPFMPEGREQPPMPPPRSIFDE